MVFSPALHSNFIVITMSQLKLGSGPQYFTCDRNAWLSRRQLILFHFQKSRKLVNWCVFVRVLYFN